MNLLQQLGNRRRHFIVYLFPPLLIIVNYLVFSLFVSTNGLKEGYLSGMVFYWVVFCIIPILLWIRKPNRKLLFKIKKLNNF